MYHPQHRTSRKLSLLVALFCLAVSARAADIEGLRIRNVGEVNSHLYRGGEPSAGGLQDLAHLHFTLVIDLREPGVATETEKRTVQALHMSYTNVPLPPLSAPTDPEIRRVLSLIVPDDQGRIFVHCRRGKDRTGTVIACYRIQHDGWPRSRALAEAASYGMSRVEFGMRSFILNFSPVDLPSPLATRR